MVGSSLFLISCEKQQAASIPVVTLPSGVPFVLVQPPSPPAPHPTSGKPGASYIGVFSGIVDSGGTLVVTGYQGTILRRSAGSQNWDRLVVPIHSDFYGITRTPSGTLWVAGDRGALLRSADSGRTFQIVPTGIAPLFLNAISFPSDKVGYAVGEKGVILKTSDGGDHWSRLKSPTDENLYAVAFSDETHGMIAGWHKTLLRSEDGGQTFESIDIPMQKVTRQKPSFNSLWVEKRVILLAGDHGLLFSSGDGGKSFTQMQTGSLNDLYGVCRTGTGTVAVAGEQGTLILLDSDGAGHWALKTPLGKFNGSDFLGITCESNHVRVVGTNDVILLPSPLTQ